MRRRTTGSSSRPTAPGERRRGRRRRAARPSTPSTHSPPRSCASEPIVMRQPSLSSPTRFSFGTTTSVKNTSANSARPADVAQRAHVDAGRVHVDDQHRDALVLRHVGIGAHVAEALLGDHGVARPHLLAVDDEAVAVVDGARSRGRRGRSRRSARSCRCTRPCRRGWRPAPAPAARRCRTRGASGRRSRTRRSGATGGCRGGPAPRGR